MDAFKEKHLIPEKSNFIEIKSTKKKIGDRLEWRKNKKGDLIGVCWRKRNSERKATRYVGKRKSPIDFQRFQKVYNEKNR